MVKNFKADLERGQAAELLVKEILEGRTKEYTFKWVGDDPAHFSQGDIVAFGENRLYYIEVKDDTIISTSGRVLCEEEVYYKEGDYYRKGFMYNDYEIFCVVSRAERKLYFFDFKVLKEIYKSLGEYKLFDYYDQSSDTYLLELCHIKKYGGVLAIIDY